MTEEEIRQEETRKLNAALEEEKRRKAAFADGAAQRNEARTNQVQQQQRQSEFDKRIAAAEAARKQDISRGRELAGEVIGDGLSRLEEGRASEVSDIIGRRKAIADTAGQRSTDIENVLAARRQGLAEPEALSRVADLREQGLEGFSREELAGLESQRLGGIGRSEQTALRQLRGLQGAAGIRGGLAGAQQADILQGGAQQRAQLAQDLFLAGEQRKRAALGEFEQSAFGREAAGQARTGALEASARAAETEDFARRNAALEGLQGATAQARQEEIARSQFNIGQEQAEKSLELQSIFGQQQLGVQERGGVSQAINAEREVAAREKELADDSYICTEMYKQGILTKQQYRKAGKIFLIATLRKPIDALEYYINGPAIVASMKEHNFDFTTLKSGFVGQALSLLDQGKRMEAVKVYTDGTRTLRNKYLLKEVISHA